MKRRGFTLVELVIAMCIMALLISMATLVYSNIRFTARQVTAQANAQAVVRAVNIYNTYTTGVKINALTVASNELANLQVSAEDAGGKILRIGIRLTAEELVFARGYIKGNVVDGFEFKETYN